MTKRIGIDMVPRHLPGSEHSHTGAWAYVRANQLKHAGEVVEVLSGKNDGVGKSDWAEFSKIYLYHTMDFDPEHPYAINIFDGPQEHQAKHFERFIWPQHAGVQLVSLDYPMPNYGYRCKRKRDNADATSKMSNYWKNVDWDAVDSKCLATTDWVLDPGVKLTKGYVGRTKADWLKQCDGLTHLWPKLTIGDSHAPSAYVPKSLILRKDGRTMRGFIRKTIEREVKDFGFDWDQVKELTCYHGSIDIRHHLCREADPVAAAKALIGDYVKMLQATGRPVELVHPLPIEWEGRKLPSTGYHLGTPFFGTRAQRQELVDVFKTELSEAAQKNSWTTFTWPDAWYKMDGQEFAETIMERPRSVHLSRKFYRWDLVNDRPNPELSKTTLLEF